MNQNSKSTKQFAVALAAVLGGVALGSFIVIRRDEPGQSQRPLPIPSGLGKGAQRDNSWTNDMVWIRGGTFWMGSADGSPDEQPTHEVTVDGFWMDQTEVTNEQFEKFARATGYVTVARRKRPMEDGRRISGRAVSQMKTLKPTVSVEPPRLPVSRPTATGFMTWRAMFGSGATIGIGLTTTPAVRRRIPKARLKASIRTNRAVRKTFCRSS